MGKFKKGDKVRCISSQTSLEFGKTYEVLKTVDNDAIELCGIKDLCFLACNFKKVVNIKQIKKLDDMQIINSRSEVNAEKINEIIDVVNQIAKLVGDESNE